MEMPVNFQIILPLAYIRATCRYTVTCTHSMQCCYVDTLLHEHTVCIVAM